MIARLAAVGFVALLAVGCASSPAGPTALPAPVAALQMDYDINIPDLLALQGLKAQYPQGVHVPPAAAQARWDYTAAYGGSPNVYLGPVSGPCQQYYNTGIVIAPVKVAQLPTFTAEDWPGIGLEPGRVYEWVGRFTFAQAAPAGSYRPGCGVTP